MFFIFTFGVKDFFSTAKGYEDMTLVCSNCRNANAHPVVKRRFFTFCFVPIFPIGQSKEIRCGTCDRHQKTNEQELERIRQQGPSAIGPPPPGHYPQQGYPPPGYPSPQGYPPPQGHLPPQGYPPPQEYQSPHGYQSPAPTHK